MKTLTILKPDDWHLHLREGPVLKNIIHFTAEYFGRAIVMPNTKTPITSIDRCYRTFSVWHDNGSSKMI